MLTPCYQTLHWKEKGLFKRSLLTHLHKCVFLWLSNPRLEGRNKQTSELEASWVYIVISRQAKATQWDSIKEKQDNNNKKKWKVLCNSFVRTGSWLRGARLEKVLFRLYLQSRSHKEPLVSCRALQVRGLGQNKESTPRLCPAPRKVPALNTFQVL